MLDKFRNHPHIIGFLEDMLCCHKSKYVEPHILSVNWHVLL